MQNLLFLLCHRNYKNKLQFFTMFLNSENYGILCSFLTIKMNFETFSTLKFQKNTKMQFFPKVTFQMEITVCEGML